MAATVPIALIGLGLMLYNALRFDNPFEFGWHYQLAGTRQVTRQFFSLRYLWFNFRVYFLEPARWSARFPFVHEIAVPPLPAGYYTGAKHPFGVLTNIPLVWLALAAPLAWRGRSGQAGSILRWFVTAVALLFGMCALTLGLFCGASFAMRWSSCRHCCCWRWLASSDWSARWPRPRSRGWLAGRSGGVRRAGVGACCWASRWRLTCWRASSITPRRTTIWGMLWRRRARSQEAIAHYEQALRIKPDYAEAHNNLGIALAQAGKIAGSDRALRAGAADQARFRRGALQSGDRLGASGQDAGGDRALRAGAADQARLRRGAQQSGDRFGASGQDRRKPSGTTSRRCGSSPITPRRTTIWGSPWRKRARSQEAIGHYEQALRIKPDYAEAHYNLGIALEQAGRVQEAIGHYEQALRIKPDFAERIRLGDRSGADGQVRKASDLEQALDQAFAQRNGWRDCKLASEARNRLGILVYRRVTPYYRGDGKT